LSEQRRQSVTSCIVHFIPVDGGRTGGWKGAKELREEKPRELGADGFDDEDEDME